jgi:hypothetical protein
MEENKPNMTINELIWEYYANVQQAKDSIRNGVPLSRFLRQIYDYHCGKCKIEQDMTISELMI